MSSKLGLLSSFPFWGALSRLFWRALDLPLSSFGWLFSLRIKNTDLGSLGPQKSAGDGYDDAPDIDYEPPVLAILHHSKYAVVTRVEQGVILKHPRYVWWDHPDAENTNSSVLEAKIAFHVEEEVLKVLGDHPRIVRFLGASNDPRGLRFTEANPGSLQRYIDHHFDEIDPTSRIMWCLQAAEAIAYIHSKGVIHSDLRPENFLLHRRPDGRCELLLCDFGGATYGDLTGGQLPDAGFFDPRREWVSTEATDIFALGSVSYTIMTGHWPHWVEGEERLAYMDRVDDLFLKNDFPSTDMLHGGRIIRGCWMDQYHKADCIVADYRRLERDHPALP